MFCQTVNTKNIHTYLNLSGEGSPLTEYLYLFDRFFNTINVVCERHVLDNELTTLPLQLIYKDNTVQVFSH